MTSRASLLRLPQNVQIAGAPLPGDAEPDL
jgi:hypothetical protein